MKCFVCIRKDLPPTDAPASFFANIYIQRICAMVCLGRCLFLVLALSCSCFCCLLYLSLAQVVRMCALAQMGDHMSAELLVFFVHRARFVRIKGNVQRTCAARTNGPINAHYRTIPRPNVHKKLFLYAFIFPVKVYLPLMEY